MLHKALDAFPRRPARRLAACRLRQSARQRFGSRSVAKCPLTRQRFSLRPPRETSRHDKSGCGTPGCRPVTPPGAPAPRGSRSCSARQPLLPVFGAPCRSLGRGAGPQVRCVAGPRDLRGVDCFDYAGILVPATALASPSMPRNLPASSRGHNKNLFSSPCPHWPEGRFSPPSLPEPREHFPHRAAALRHSATASGSDGAWSRHTSRPTNTTVSRILVPSSGVTANLAQPVPFSTRPPLTFSIPGPPSITIGSMTQHYVPDRAAQRAQSRRPDRERGVCGVQ